VRVAVGETADCVGVPVAAIGVRDAVRVGGMGVRDGVRVAEPWVRVTEAPLVGLVSARTAPVAGPGELAPAINRRVAVARVGIPAAVGSRWWVAVAVRLPAMAGPAEVGNWPSG
jgi:hypothetical protein